jgi:hypothetical protein
MTQPKAHKYNRSQRLLCARNWMQKYSGKRIYHGYAKYFGVSKLCAVSELEILGVIFPPDLKDSLIRAENNKCKQREKAKNKQENQRIDIEDNFAYIMGYTSGGIPYGLNWDEAEYPKNNGENNVSEEYLSNEELPF